MSNYIVHEDNGIVIGAFADLESAQIKSYSLASIYASISPSLSIRSTPACYACIHTKTTSRDYLGIILTTSQESVVKSWIITTSVFDYSLDLQSILR